MPELIIKKFKLADITDQMVTDTPQGCTQAFVSSYIAHMLAEHLHHTEKMECVTPNM